MMLGAQLKKARESKRMSQHEVSEQLNISQKTLSNIESDKSQPSINQLAVMGCLYELDVIELLSRHGISLENNFKKASSNNNIDQEEVKALHLTLLQEKDSQISALEDCIQKLKEQIYELKEK
jgi:transcriptional regulator with XRE-family HTH domain